MTETFSNNIEDHKCVLCLEMKVNPVVLECGHSFCNLCLCKMSHSQMRRKSQRLPKDIKEFRCGLCRREYKNFIIEEDEEYDGFLKEKFPDCYKKRIAEAKKEKKSIESRKYIRKSIQVGNKYKYHGYMSSCNKHEWTLYFRVDRDILERIEVSLPEDFYPTLVKLSPRRPLELTKFGYAEFDIDYEVIFKKELGRDSFRGSYRLKFKEGGGRKVVPVDFVSKKRARKKKKRK